MSCRAHPTDACASGAAVGAATT
ncbi:MAG: hypothetical protein JWP15_1893, partial [Alphaproteobacteria bacterium]|nr:hypothetical protein [Alphaproteobacteria bacterium]